MGGGVRVYTGAQAPVAQWKEQRFPKPRALVRFRPGASLHRLQEVASLQEFFLSFILAEIFAGDRT
jgi:hypothetical protein